MSPHAAPFREALDLLLCMIALPGTSAWIDVERYEEGEPVKHTWSPIRGWRDRVRIRTTIEELDLRYSPEMALVLPRPKLGFGTATATSVLWCRVEGKEQLQRARKFRPLPTLVLQEGASSRRLLLWALQERLQWEPCVTMNKRIAYRIGAVQKHGDPDTLKITPPGTCLRHGLKRPVPVRVARLTYDVYTAAQIAGRLKHPPPADAWMNGRVAGARR